MNEQEFEFSLHALRETLIVLETRATSLEERARLLARDVEDLRESIAKQDRDFQYLMYFCCFLLVAVVVLIFRVLEFNC